MGIDSIDSVQFTMGLVNDIGLDQIKDLVDKLIARMFDGLALLFIGCVFTGVFMITGISFINSLITSVFLMVLIPWIIS